MAEQLWVIDSKRQTEWLAVFLMLRGYVPSIAYNRSYGSPASVYRSPRSAGQVTRLSLSDGWLYRPMMKECRECGQYYPEDSTCWPKNKDGKNGFYSKCIGCKREADARGKRKKRAKMRMLPA
jgi:Pyruvate/2-oxoacid:ferredoxin oxidoreductase delta subunit